MEKTLGNTDANAAKKNVKDIQFWGDGDMFKLLCKASSQKEGWMKSTKAMEIQGVGCVVQVTTQQMNDTDMIGMIEGTRQSTSVEEGTIKHSVIAEAITFVPNVKIEETFNSEDNGADKIVISRKLVPINYIK